LGNREGKLTKNLFDLTYGLASELGILTESLATGGSTTTVVDTVTLTQADDYWNNGTVWVIWDAGDASAAPQGEYAIVSDFVASTDTATIGAVTVAVASGDRYAIANKRFPLHDLISAINRAIRDIGSIPTVDTTTINTAAAQTEYTPPVAANHDLREVWLQWKMGDANDNQWYKVRNWYMQRAEAIGEIGGTADTLVFPEQPPYPRDVKLVYMAPHAALVSSTDNLYEAIDYRRVIYRAAVHALKHSRMKTRSNDEFLLQAIQDYEQRADQADLMYPVRAPKKLGKMMDVSVAPSAELAPGENTIP
jgi:hypothetical protein